MWSPYHRFGPDLLRTGWHSTFCSYCSLLFTSRTAGEGSRQRGSAVANSNWLSRVNWSSCVHLWPPSLMMLYISDNRDYKERDRKRFAEYTSQNIVNAVAKEQGNKCLTYHIWYIIHLVVYVFLPGWDSCLHPGPKFYIYISKFVSQSKKKSVLCAIVTYLRGGLQKNILCVIGPSDRAPVIPDF